METKYIKQYIEDMEGDKRADNLTEFGECLLKELKQLLSVCEQKQTEQQSNCNLPHVSNNEVAVCDHKIIKKGFHKGRCACGLFKEKQ